MSKSIQYEYQRIVVESVANDYKDNYDALRFGPVSSAHNPTPAPPGSVVSRIKSATRRVLSHAKWGLINALKEPSRRRALIEKANKFIEPNIDNFQWLYTKLADDQSRQLLVKLLAYRALGHRHVKLPLSTPEFWKARSQQQELRVGEEAIETGFLGWKAYRTNLRSIGFPFEIFVPSIQEQFLLAQYRAELQGGAIDVEAGDVVIDAGGCYGDSALYFSHKAGPDGHVYSVEFLPESLNIFEKNLAINPDYSRRITIIRQPLWNKSDLDLFIEGNGPATRVLERSSDPNSARVRTVSIDDLVIRESLNKLDFIKMDIEGAEIEALKGAQQAITRFRPKLAISVYHRLSDFWDIPRFIEHLGLGYRFYLRHFTVHQEETVLFAEAPR